MLRYALNEASEIKKDYGQVLHQDDYIFINQSTGKPYNITYLNGLMDDISIESGVKCTPHMMRHTFATYARVEGINARLLADYLGHKNTTMTDHYSHQTVEGMEKVIDLSSRKLR